MRSVFRSINSRSPFSFVDSKNLNQNAISALSHLERTTARSLNSAPNFRYTGSGNKKKASTPKIKLKHLSKKQGPITIIISLIAGGLFLIFGSSSLLGPHMEELLTRATDSQFSTYSLSTRQITKEILAGKQKPSPYLKRRLKKQGIKLKKSTNAYTFQYKNKTITAQNFKQTMRSDLSFREAFTRAKRGRAANFFDKSSDKVFKKIGLTHNIMSNYKQTGDNKTDQAKYDRTMTKHFSGDTDTSLNTASDQKTTDEHNKVTEERISNGDSVSSQNTSGNTPRTKARAFLSNTAAKVSNAGGVGCAALAAGNLVSVAIAANDIYQSIHFFSTGMENQSKTKSGKGNEANIHSFLNFMTTSKTTKYTDVSTGKEKTITGSPLESEGMKLALSDSKPNKALSRNFSIESPFTTTASAITTAGHSLVACSAIRTTSAIISLASLAIPGGGFIKATVGLLNRSVLIKAGLKIGVITLLSALIPAIAKTMFTNTYSTATGIPAGDLFVKGASATNSRLARSANGDSVSSSAQIQSFHQNSSPILAEESQSKRQNSHPLDISNPYTFLGNIFVKFSNFSHQNHHLSQVFHNFSSLTSNSLHQLTSSYATGEDTEYLTTFGNCPKLEAIGAKGDIYCNPISVGDTSTTSIPSNDATFTQVLAPNLENNNQIKANSELAKYILFCTERDSPFGIVDANISNALNTSFGTVGDNLPIIEDIVDIINAGENIANQDWATGKTCVNSKDNPRWNSEFKYYNEWIRRQRIIDQMSGSTSEDSNPILSFKNNYEKNHPLDNSASGYLSRISGLTKSDASKIIASLKYQNFVDTYHTAQAKNQKPKQSLTFKIAKKSPAFIVPNHHFVAPDLRNQRLTA